MRKDTDYLLDELDAEIEKRLNDRFNKHMEELVFAGLKDTAEESGKVSNA